MNSTSTRETTRWMVAGGDLATLAAEACTLAAVRRSDVCPGDTVVVATRNSFYALAALGTGEFAVSGGWFAEHQTGPARVAVNGCTWGGRAIITDVLAAPGLFLEFGNGVRTTRIRAVVLVSGRQNATAN
jgi:hypothetical protein